MLQRHSHSVYQRSRTSDVRRALIASGIFGKIDPATMSVVSEQLEPMQFSPGDVVDAQTDCGGCVYVIMFGKVKVIHRNRDGSEMVLTILGPGEIFGAIALFDPDSREIMATALTEVVAVPIERAQFLAWIAEYPEFRDQVLRLFARWVKASTNSLVDFGFADVQSRVANQLLSLRKRFGRREGEVVRVVHDLTMEDFSLLIGAAAETIGETLHEFEGRGWIRLEDNSIVIVDAHALASEPHKSSPEVHCV
jgi:CRP/FNR family cyclic AMP-dependent transcriptional regulator